MIGAIVALALQAIGADAAASAGADARAAPASSNAVDAIADILAHTPAEPPSPAPEPNTPQPSPPPVVASPSSPETSPEQRARMYKSGVRSSFQARQSRQGPLDGRWVLNDPDGKGLYMLQLADPGAGRGPVEGAWRDLGRQGAADASGFLISADRSGQTLVLTFEEGNSCVVTLMLGADGRWTGALRTANRNQPVVMTRS